MGSWREVLDEINTAGSGFDVIRRRYLRKLKEHTGRNIVLYYSGFLQKHHPDIGPLVSINDEDKNGFMASFKGIDRNIGLDIIMHSPGGDVAATESIIDYLRCMFDNNIRVFVPQISMSGGTMIACSAKEIWMGMHSNLGPIDPQFGGIPAFLAKKELEQAKEEIARDPNTSLYWNNIIGQYPPAFYDRCKSAIEWSEGIATKALKTGMFRDDPDKDEKVKSIVSHLLSHDTHKAHARHLHRDTCAEIGLNIRHLEDDNALQDLVLSIHHAIIITFMNTDVVKLIENHNGIAMLKLWRQSQNAPAIVNVNNGNDNTASQGNNGGRNPGIIKKLLHFMW